MPTAQRSMSSLEILQHKVIELKDMIEADGGEIDADTIIYLIDNLVASEKSFNDTFQTMHLS